MLNKNYYEKMKKKHRDTVLTAILAASMVCSGSVTAVPAYAAEYTLVSAGAGSVMDEGASVESLEIATDSENSGDEEKAEETGSTESTEVLVSSSEETAESSHAIDSDEDLTSKLNAGAAAEDDIREKAEAIADYDQDQDGKIAGYVNIGVAHVDNHLNIRENPDENSDLVGKMTKDAGCEILEVSGNWAHIESGKVNGWCKTEFLYMGDEAKARAKEAMKLVATVQTTTLFVRDEPNTDSAVLTMIPIDEDYEIEEQDGDWLKIAVDDDEGWISADYVKISEQLDKAMNLTELKYGEGVSDVRVNLVNYAKQFIGNPYVWGGTSLTKGADCSGYVQSIYRKYGISLPRTSAAQSTVGKKISPSEAQPGDLFFYAKSRGRISHVGIYIGNGQIVNAHSRKTGIRINSAYYRTPAVVRRVLD